jgi:hypothetical protein
LDGHELHGDASEKTRKCRDQKEVPIKDNDQLGHSKTIYAVDFFHLVAQVDFTLFRLRCGGTTMSRPPLQRSGSYAALKFFTYIIRT